MADKKKPIKQVADKARASQKAPVQKEIPPKAVVTPKTPESKPKPLPKEKPVQKPKTGRGKAIGIVGGMFLFVVASVWGGSQISGYLFDTERAEANQYIESFDRALDAGTYSVVAKSQNISDVDIMVMLDTTSSMGSEFAYLRSNAMQIAEAVSGATSGANVRFGLTLYKDFGDEFVSKPFGFFENPEEFQSVLASQGVVGGGGDWPEATAEGLRDALNSDWVRSDTSRRVIVHFTDAEPKQNSFSEYTSLLERASAEGIQMVNVMGSSVSREARHVMERSSDVTSGATMAFDKSGGMTDALAQGMAKVMGADNG